jgi:hypothetical protein
MRILGSAANGRSVSLGGGKDNAAGHDLTDDSGSVRTSPAYPHMPSSLAKENMFVNG